MKIHRHNNQRGIAILMALICLLLLTAIAATMIFSSNIESSINTNYRSEQQAYFAARAGIEEARIRMLRPTNDQAQPAGTGDLCGGSIADQTCPLLPQFVPGQNGGAVKSTDTIYIVNPSTVNAAPGAATEVVNPQNAAASYFDDELCKENYQNYGLVDPGKGLRCGSVPATTWYQTPSQINAALANSLDPNTTTDQAMAYKWVRIALKQDWNTAAVSVDNQSPGSGSANKYSSICYDINGNEVVQATLGAGYNKLCFPTSSAFNDNYRPVYVITSMAMTPNGSRRYLQSEVADPPPFITNASLDTQSIVNINGASVTVNGNDNCACTCTVGKGAAAPVCVDNSTGQACTTGQEAIYSTQSVTNGGAIVAPTNPTFTQNASTFPYNVDELIANYQALANSFPFGQTTCPSGGCSGSNADFGTPPTPFPPVGNPGPPTENPCQGDISSGTVGKYCTNTTYIPGSASFSSHLQGAGILIVNGDLTITGGANFYGLIIVKGTLTIKGSGSGQNSNIIGGIITGKGTVTDQTDNLNGGINIQYDSCALRHQQNLQPPKVLSMRELSF